MLANRLRSHGTVSSGLIIPDARVLGLVGYAPVVSKSNAQVFQPGTGEISFIGRVPTLPSGNKNITPAARSMVVASSPPDVIGFAVTASNVFASASGPLPHGTVSSGASPPNPSISDGSGSYTYSWTFVSDDSGFGTAAIAGPTLLNPTWSKTGIADGDDIVNTWKITVTDTGTGKTTWRTISITLSWTQNPPP